MVITTFAVRKDTLKWTFALLLMARSDLLPSITTKAISMESTVFWLSGVAHRALAGRGSASPA